MQKCINCQMDDYGPFFSKKFFAKKLIWFKWTSMTIGNLALRSFVYCYPIFGRPYIATWGGWFLRRKLFVWTFSARAFTLQNMEPMHQKILYKPLRLLLLSYIVGSSRVELIRRSEAFILLLHPRTIPDKLIHIEWKALAHFASFVALHQQWQI